MARKIAFTQGQFVTIDPNAATKHGTLNKILTRLKCSVDDLHHGLEIVSVKDDEIQLQDPHGTRMTWVAARHFTHYVSDFKAGHVVVLKPEVIETPSTLAILVGTSKCDVSHLNTGIHVKAINGHTLECHHPTRKDESFMVHQKYFVRHQQQEKIAA